MLTNQELWEFAQTQQSIIEMLKNQIAVLESRIDELESACDDSNCVPFELGV